ncbi:hypothetical protein PCH70_37410 [Pseudomonas cichorii JBC1]|nr:hypothetical protein PCH70_37410 [Pseudomonas cichorii JBC1]
MTTPRSYARVFCIQAFYDAVGLIIHPVWSPWPVIQIGRGVSQLGSQRPLPKQGARLSGITERNQRVIRPNAQ